MSKSIHIKAGENLFDAAIRLCGHMEGLLHIAEKNNIGFTDEVLAGQLLSGNNISIEKKSVVIIPKSELIYDEVKVLAGQSLFDIAIQEYGNIEGVLSLSKDNGLSFTDDLEVAQILKVGALKENQKVIDHFKNSKLKPASGLTETEADELKPEGISYWALGYDFIVS